MLLVCAVRCLVAIAILLGIVCIAPPAAFAQRGQGYAQRTSQSVALSRFPGLLDTHTLKKGETLGDLPFFRLEHGITDNLSLGTSLLLDSVFALAGAGVHFQLRYRAIEQGPYKLVVDLMGTYFDVNNNEEDISSFIGYAGSNLSYRIDSASQVTGSAKLFYQTTKQKGLFGPDAPDLVARQDLRALMLAATYERRIKPWLLVQASAVSFPYIQGEVDSALAAADIDVDADIAFLDRSFARILVNLQWGKWELFGGQIIGRNFSSPQIGLGRIWD